MYYIILLVMHMGIEKKTYSFRLDEGLVEKLRIIAETDNRSLSNLVETVLKKYAEAYENSKAE